MTQQVRKGYRNHRKATWALVLAVVAAIATVVIPFASGAPSKYYTLGASPEPTCSTPTRQEFTLTLSNKTRNQNLGSMNIEAPSYIQLVTGSTPLLTGSAGQATVNEPDGFGDTANTIRLRNLTLPTNTSTATVTVLADVSAGSGQTWKSIAKQSNNFADSGPGNLFAPLTEGAGSPPATVTVCALDYVFVDQPNNAEKGSAQSVQVELQSNGVPVTVSGALTLSAFQTVGTTTTAVDSRFNTPPPGLMASAPDPGNLQWTFSIVGNTSGTGYTLKAGNTVSNPFAIVDGLCNPGVTDPEHLNGSCSLTSNLNGGILESGITINNHDLQPIGINFAAGSTATDKCANWTRAFYTGAGQTYFFPGVELDLTWGGGVLQVIYRVRNADWVLTEAARGNQDIQICAGARHQDASKNGDGSAPRPFTTKFGVDATWDGELYWGVLPTVQNPSKVRAGGDPAVCGRGTQDLPTGPSLSLETWRTWTICIPYDWDWKNFG
jgi:hypothetical protein